MASLAFLAQRADYIGVAIVEEGIALRRLGIRKPILVLGGTLPDQVPLFLKHDLTLTASSVELLEAAQAFANAQGGRLKVHLKIDTGMERLGVHDYDAKAFIKRSLSCGDLDIEGIFTHLANSDRADLSSRQAAIRPLLRRAGVL